MRSVPVTEPKYVLPLISITSLFFLGALGVNGNDALIPQLKRAFQLTGFRWSLIQTASVPLIATGTLSIWAVALIGLFNSIMFPTIFALSLKDLGPYTKRASSLLVMAIIGAAAFSPMMCFISDRTNIQTSFLVPVICYAVVFYFAVWGYKPFAAEGIVEPVAAEMVRGPNR